MSPFMKAEGGDAGLKALLIPGKAQGLSSPEAFPSATTYLCLPATKALYF